MGRLAGEEPGVDRHQRDAHERAADEDLDALDAVGHERRDAAIVGLDAECPQRVREAARPIEQRAEGQLAGAMGDRNSILVAGARRREHLADGVHAAAQHPCAVNGTRCGNTIVAIGSSSSRLASSNTASLRSSSG